VRNAAMSLVACTKTNIPRWRGRSGALSLPPTGPPSCARRVPR
jgi:hypothetical protein